MHMVLAIGVEAVAVAVTTVYPTYVTCWLILSAG